MNAARPEMLHLLWAVPVFVLLAAHGLRRRRRILARFCEAGLLPNLTPDASPARDRLRAGLVVASVALLVLALAGPQYGYTWKEVQKRGVSLIIALDCSKSMLAEDVKPNRLKRAKREILDLLDRLTGDRVGLVGFAGSAFLQCPLTQDYGGFHLFLGALTPDYLPVGGTDLAEAVHVALASFEPDDPADKAVILITDGESTTRDPLPAAREAAEAGVRIFTIGVGAPEGSPIPEPGGGFKKDASGRIVVSRLNEGVLKSMAEAAGGAYQRSVSGDMDLEAIYENQIKSKMTETELESGRKKLYTDRYRWFLGLAAIALAASMLLPRAKKSLMALLACLTLAAAPAAAEEGAAAFKKGNYQEALRAYVEAKAEAPEDPRLDYNLGAVFYKLGQYEKAAQSFQAALSAPDDALKEKSLYNLGNVAFRQGDLPRAVDYYQKALALDPDDLDARKNLAFVKKMMEKKPPTRPNPNSGDQPQDQSKKPESRQKPKDQSAQSGDQKGGGPQKQAQQKSPPSPDEKDRGREKKPGGADRQKARPASPDQNGENARPASTRPKADDGREKEKPTPPASAQDQDRGGEGQQAAGGGRKRRPGDNGLNEAASRRMLNRLKDQPGRALVPRYGPRRVEKDW